MREYKNKQRRKFKRVCPSCGTPDKVVIRCRSCGRYACRECSVGVICLDCYVTRSEEREVMIYRECKKEDIRCRGVGA